MTPLDIEPRESRAVNPATGELIDLHAATTVLARCLADMRDIEAQWRDLKSAVTAELLRRMDREARYTLHEDGLTIKGASPAPAEEYDAPELRDALLELVVRRRGLPRRWSRCRRRWSSPANPMRPGSKPSASSEGRTLTRSTLHTRTVEKRRYISVTGA